MVDERMVREMLDDAGVEFVEVKSVTAFWDTAVVLADGEQAKVVLFSDWCVAYLFDGEGKLLETGMYHLKDFGLSLGGELA